MRPKTVRSLSTGGGFITVEVIDFGDRCGVKIAQTTNSGASGVGMTDMITMNVEEAKRLCNVVMDAIRASGCEHIYKQQRYGGWGNSSGFVRESEVCEYNVPRREKGMSEHLRELKERHKNHGRAWSKEDDVRLLKLSGEGKTVQELMEIFQRSRSSITSRIKKLNSTL